VIILRASLYSPGLILTAFATTSALGAVAISLTDLANIAGAILAG
jgi:hypothetical protein